MTIENNNLVNASDAISEIHGHLYFGKMIRSLRQCEEISQVDMAKRLGISRQYLCNIESGARTADVEMAVKFAQIFNHPTEFFVSRLLEDQLYVAGLDFKVQLLAS